MNGIEKIGNRTPAQGQTGPDKEKKLRKACADFEALLTYNLLKTMRRTIPSGGAIPRSSSRETYEMMLDQHIADAVSRRGQGIGLQKALYEQMAPKHLNRDSSSPSHASIKEINTSAGHPHDR